MPYTVTFYNPALKITVKRVFSSRDEASRSAVARTSKYGKFEGFRPPTIEYRPWYRP